MATGRNYAAAKARARLMRPSRDPREEYTSPVSLRGLRLTWPDEFPVVISYREAKPKQTDSNLLIAPDRITDRICDGKR